MHREKSKTDFALDDGNSVCIAVVRHNAFGLISDSGTL